MDWGKNLKKFLQNYPQSEKADNVTTQAFPIGNVCNFFYKI